MSGFFEDNLINLMPRKFRSVVAWRDFMTSVGQMLDGVHAKIDGLADLQDPDTVPSAYLQNLADNFGFALHDSPGTADVDRKRILLKSVVDIIKSKGQAGLVEDLAHFLYFVAFPDTWMDVHELWTDDYLNFRIDDWESVYVPVGWVGDGVTTTFTTTVALPPIRARSLKITSVDAVGGTLLVWEDSSGELQGDLTAGSVNLTTGAVSVTFDSPPGNGEDVVLTYTYEGDQYLSPHFLLSFPANIFWDLGQTSITVTPSGWVGNGVVVNFTAILVKVRVKPGTLEITATDVLGFEMTVTDDGLGNLVGDVGSGNNSIDYDTGDVDVTFEASVGVGEPIVVTYKYQNLYLGRQRLDALLAYLERYRPAHTVRHAVIGQNADFWRVGTSHWRVGGTGSPAPDVDEVIRVGGWDVWL